VSGERNLDQLLKTLTATLHDDTYVFATVAKGMVPPGLSAVMQFEETEGTTLILREADALALGIAFEFPCKKITLNVHSSLEAIGFIARIATELARHGMGVNPVSGFYHDHLFVPLGREEEAIAVLTEISEFARAEG